MLDSPDEINTILTHKTAMKYSGSDLDAMRAIAAAAKKRSLADFNRVSIFLEMAKFNRHKVIFGKFSFGKCFIEKIY